MKINCNMKLTCRHSTKKNLMKLNYANTVIIDLIKINGRKITLRKSI